MPQPAQVLEIGDVVELELQHPRGAAPVGEIQAIGTWGIRMTLIDWLTCRFTGYDMAVPWDEIRSIPLIATKDHALDLDEIVRCQARYGPSETKKPRP